jgi:nucleotide-binding universal stress UspA family protein
MEMMTKIVVALDGSDHALRAADVAADIAQKFDAQLHLVHVIPKEKIPYELREFAEAEHVESPEVLERDIARESVIESVEASVADKGVAEIETVVLNGDPVEEIKGYAERIGADMIVIGRRGLGQISGILLGSVSAKLNQVANCPVVTVK